MEGRLQEVRGKLMLLRNQFNNCVDNDLIPIIINEISKLEVEENNIYRELKARLK